MVFLHASSDVAAAGTFALHGVGVGFGDGRSFGVELPKSRHLNAEKYSQNGSRRLLDKSSLRI